MTGDPTHAFVYRAPCGCVRGIVVDDSEAAPQWTAERRAAFDSVIYVEERWPIEQARRDDCRHVRYNRRALTVRQIDQLRLFKAEQDKDGIIELPIAAGGAR